VVSGEDRRKHVKHDELDDVKTNLSVSEFVDPLFATKNRFKELEEIEVSNEESAEICVTAAILKDVETTTNWNLEKNHEVCIFRKTNKPVIVLQFQGKIWEALIDTGSERCLLNYENFKCLKNEPLKHSAVKVKGVVGNSDVIGEVKLNLVINKNTKLSTEALILRNAQFPYDIILGRDVLQNAEVNLNNGTLSIENEVVHFMRKEEQTKSKVSMVTNTDCLISDVMLQANRRKKSV